MVGILSNLYNRTLSSRTCSHFSERHRTAVLTYIVLFQQEYLSHSLIVAFPNSVWQSGDPNEAACDGCQTPCDDDGCFEEPPLVPICAEAMEHTSSAGGTNNITLLRVDDGFWRATPYAMDVLPCYNADACLAGVTNSSGSCLDGYEGPCEWFSQNTPTAE